MVSGVSITTIVIVAVAAIILLLYLFIQNKKDKNSVFPPVSTDDTTESFRIEQNQKRDKI